MDLAPVLSDRDRLAALRRLVLLDTPPSDAFDRLTRLAANLLGCPVSMLTLIDAERQWFKSSYGLPEPLVDIRETGLEHSLCKYAVASDRPFVVSDAAECDLRHHPAVLDLGMRCYAGTPLHSPEGHAVGTLCVVDVAPHDWTEKDLVLLGDLGAIAERELVLHVHERVEAHRRLWGTIPHGSASWS
jgi:GAF domain-containing protein